MSSQYQFQTVAIAGGTGGVGTFISDAFLADKGFKVKILTRNNTAKGTEKAGLIEKFKTAGAEILVTDDGKDLADLLKGVDAVVCAYGGAAIAEEYKLLEAAKKAGVKRFIPSEFGCDPRHGLNELSPLFKVKDDFNQNLFKSGLEWTIIPTGFFTDMLFAPFFGFDFANKKVTIVGEGNTPIAFTHRKDVGRIIVATLKNPAKSKNTYVTVPTEERTWLQAIKDFNVQGVEVTHLKTEDIQKAIANNPNPWATILDQLRVTAALGKSKMYSLSNPADFPVPNRITIAEFAKSQRN